MIQSDLDAKRQQLEAVYKKEIRELDRKRKELDAWMDERLLALSLISDGDRWLKLPDFSSGQPQNESPPKPSLRTRARSPQKPVVQTDEIRAAINSLKEDISITSVQHWLKKHRPEINEAIKPRSIRTLLWRMNTQGELKYVRTDGGAKVYDLVDKKGPIPSGSK